MEIIANLSSVRLDPALSAVPVAAAPDAAAVQRFAALMQPPAPEAASAAVGTASVQAAAIAPQSFGDRVLSGMHSVSNDFRESWTRAAATLGPDGAAMDMKQLMSLQLHLAQASVQYELVGKAVSRAGQNIDHLVRLQ